MRRTNRKHTHAIQRHRRNQGPELFSQAADKELKDKAKDLVAGLSTATIERGSAAAASLLIDMAESADWANAPGVYRHALSLAEKWSKEPPFVKVEILDSAPELAQPVKNLRLTDGSGSDGDSTAENDDPESGTIIDAEIIEHLTPSSPPPRP